VLPWIDRHFLRADPFAFAGTEFEEFRHLVASRFGVDPNGIYCVGSGAVGLSISPGKMIDQDLKVFDSTSPDKDIRSDLDIALISEIHFETAWRELRDAVAPSVSFIPKDLRDVQNQQRNRFFDGAIIANKLLGSLSFGSDWLTQSIGISEWVTVNFNREVTINFWIYRDYWSLRNYVSKGIIECGSKMK